MFYGKNNEDPVEVFKEYKKSVRNKLAHGIVNKKGRWNDIALQNVSLISCKVVECLGR
jgi:hypothetical protein